MTQNEYLIEVMSKVDKFTDWVAKYHEVYSSNNDATWVFLAFLMAILFAPFIILASSKNNESVETAILNILSIACIIGVLMIFRDTFRPNDERYLENARITLDDLEKIKPIDFNKLPNWVQSGLKEDGYLKCEDIYKVFRDKKAQESRDAADAKRLEQIERISGDKK